MTNLIKTLSRMVGDLNEVREVVEPLQTATERVGRIAERIPGQGANGLNDGPHAAVRTPLRSG
jgi:hypothetical protein